MKSVKDWGYMTDGKVVMQHKELVCFEVRKTGRVKPGGDIQVITCRQFNSQSIVLHWLKRQEL